MCALEFKFELKTFEFKFEQKGKVFKPPQNPWTLFPSSRPNSISFLSFSPIGPAQFSYELFPLCPLINHQMHWWPINSHYDIKLCNNPLLINTHASNSNNSHHFQSKEKRKNDQCATKLLIYQYFGMSPVRVEHIPMDSKTVENQLVFLVHWKPVGWI
jgi:hypothetical protein